MVSSTSGAPKGGNGNIEIPKRLDQGEKAKYSTPKEIKTTYKSHGYQKWTFDDKKAGDGKSYISPEERAIVEAVQAKLGVGVDGVIGDKETKPAIIKFQQEHRLRTCLII